MKFINIHIPKCAGSTFTSILKSNFGVGFRDGRCLISDRSFKLSAAQVSETLSQFPTIQCLSDHKLSLDLPWSQFQMKVLCFVRDPMERLLSHYWYSRQAVPNRFDEEAIEHPLSRYLQVVLKENPRYDLQNGQTHHLCGYQDQVDFDRVTSLVDQGDLILLPVERFAEACQLLECLFPDDLPDCSYVKKNISRRDRPVTPEDREFCRPFLERDYQLWDAANDFFDQQRDQLSQQVDWDERNVDFERRCQRLGKAVNSPMIRFRKWVVRYARPKGSIAAFLD